MSVNIVTIHKHNNNYNIFNSLEEFEKLELFKELFIFLSQDCMLDTFFENITCIRDKKTHVLKKESDKFPSTNYYISTKEGCQIYVSNDHVVIIYPIKIQFLDNHRYIQEIKKVCLKLNTILSTNNFIVLFDTNKLIYDSFFKKDIIDQHKLKIANIKKIRDLKDFDKIDIYEDIFW